MEVAERKPLDATAFGAMVVLCMVWGFQQVVVKVTAPDVSLVMQGGLRSVIAAILVIGWARWRGVPLFQRDGTLASGTLVGLLFTVEFLFIFFGLGHTAASRMSVFIYLAPVLAALGLHFTVPGERLSARQWAGVLLAFSGVATAFSEGFLAAGRSTLLGDACGVAAAFFWAGTTVMIRSTRLARIPATKTFFYQIGWAALVLPAASVAIGEPGVIAVTPLAIASLAYQGILSGFATLLAWFWLLRHYLAARLGVLSFLTPMFGVVSGVVFLGEPLTGHFVLAALLVGAGIVLVNLRR